MEGKLEFLEQGKLEWGKDPSEGYWEPGSQGRIKISGYRTFSFEKARK